MFEGLRCIDVNNDIAGFEDLIDTDSTTFDMLRSTRDAKYRLLAFMVEEAKKFTEREMEHFLSYSVEILKEFQKD